MRGGLRGFAVFIACIALGVAAIAGVGSFARSLGDGLAREGRVILGGDASFSLMAREASDAERTFLADNGRLSVAATMRAMARAGTETALVEIKAVDAVYPLFGRFRSDKRATCRKSWRNETAALARPSIRRCWRGSTSSAARASPSARRPSSCAPCSRASPTSSPAASASARAC